MRPEIIKILTGAKNLFESPDIEMCRHKVAQSADGDTDMRPVPGHVGYSVQSEDAKQFCIFGACLRAAGDHSAWESSENSIEALHAVGKIVIRDYSDKMRARFGTALGEAPAWMGQPGRVAVNYNNGVAKDKHDLIEILDKAIAMEEAGA